jgi:hypothetical protein
MNAPHLVTLKRSSILGRFGRQLAGGCVRAGLFLTLMVWVLSLCFWQLFPSARSWELVSLGPAMLLAAQLFLLLGLRHPTLGVLKVDLADIDPEQLLTRGSWLALGAELPPTPEELLAAWQEKMRADAS